MMKQTLTDFQRIFKTTFAQFSPAEAESIVIAFTAEFGQQGHHYFPMWLKERQFPKEIIEVSFYESLKVHVLDFIETAKPQAYLRIHPSCNFMQIQSATKILNKEEGLYVLWNNRGPQEKKISLNEARLLDRLMEDVLFTESEIKNKDELAMIENLLQLGILLKGKAQSSQIDS